MEKIAEVAEQTQSALFDNVFAPVFFEKLAKDFNVQPQSEEEAQELLKLAIDLQEKGVTTSKQEESNERLGAIKEARAALNPGLSLHENSVESLVDVFKSNPEIQKLAVQNVLALNAMNEENQKK